MSLIARFAVTGVEPREVEGVDAAWVGAMTMYKTFAGGIAGTSVLLFVASGEVEGERSYFAAERITGSVDGGAEGSVTIHHGGLESSPESWFGHVVPHSGSGSFEGWAGTAKIEHDADGAYFVIDLS
ncbi:DUF3224 domain-containing protein [Spongisporangium articulatum]|uniref:DUF3224 domain-containing protein n=1 Tax=Spongisporangium articulatum TaxID=3362603 RepID=A0ABW8AII6_9ACTN